AIRGYVQKYILIAAIDQHIGDGFGQSGTRGDGKQVVLTLLPGDFREVLFPEAAEFRSTGAATSISSSLARRRTVLGGALSMDARRRESSARALDSISSARR